MQNETVTKRGRKPKYANAEEAKKAIQEQQKKHQQKYKEDRLEWKKQASALQKHIVKELSKNVFDNEINIQIASLIGKTKNEDETTT